MIFFLTLFFLAAALLIFPVTLKHYDNENGMRNIVMNRIAIDANSAEARGVRYMPDTAELRKQYGDRAVPDKTEYIGARDADDERWQRQDAFGSEYIIPVRGENGEIRAFLKCTYLSGDKRFALMMLTLLLVFSYAAAVSVVIILYRLLVKPFNELSEYPEKIAKGRFTEGLPQNKSGLFGKYIWGMNMLKDELSSKERNLSYIEKEKQTMIISIAHGIKTPLSNIRLYAEAIEKGLYHDDKKPDEKDAGTAKKIRENVDKVEMLVRDIMESSSDTDDGYSPVISSFYLKELMDTVKSEYSSRMELLHIPFSTVCENDPLIYSDRDGLYRVIAQLLDNAVKYGSGRGISLTMGRQDEDVIISVKNEGNALPEEETAYVFKSFWRGSNASGREGQGIGLYVAKKTAEKLGGDIFMRSDTAEDTTEVTLIVPVEPGR